MVSDEYIKALDKALSDLTERIQRRDLLHAEIAGLRETVRVLSTRVPLPQDKQQNVTQLLALADYATPSLTDAVRTLLTKVYPQELTAIEVRNKLEDAGFSFDDFSNSLSACHAALKRMVPDDVHLGKPKDGKTSYKRVLSMPPPPPTFVLGDLMGHWATKYTEGGQAVAKMAATLQAKGIGEISVKEAFSRMSDSEKKKK